MSSNKMLKKFKIDIISIAFIVLVFSMLAFLNYTYSTSLSAEDEIFEPKFSTINNIDSVELYHYETNKLISNNVNLPTKVNPANTYFFDFTIPKSQEQSYLAVNIHYVSFYIKCGDKLIYTNTNYKNKFIKSINEAFNLIPIPKEFTNQKLTISFHSNLGDFRNLTIPVISYGSKQAFLSSYIKDGLFSLFIGAFFIVSSLFLLIPSVLLIKTNRPSGNIFMIATFLFITGMYISLRSWVPYYYIPNNGLLHFIDYTTILMMPLSLYLLFVNHFSENAYYTWRIKVLKAGAIITFLNLISQYIMTLSGISEFVYFQQFTFAWVPISATIIAIILFSSDKTKLKDKKMLVLAILPLFLISATTVLIYFVSYEIKTAFLIILSLLFFSLVNFVLFIKNDLKAYNKILENSFYERLAFTDALTHIKNRNAFEEEKEKICNKQVEFKNLAVFMVDMNYLKNINDVLGHTTGDLYLKEIANILSMIENTFKNTSTYRYGGDEFIILSFDTNNNKIAKIKNTILQRTKEFMLVDNMPLSLAIGIDFEHNSENFNFENLLKNADKNMYIDKKLRKKDLKELNYGKK